MQLRQPLYILMDLGPVNNRPVYSRPLEEASEIHIEDWQYTGTQVLYVNRGPPPLLIEF